MDRVAEWSLYPTLHVPEPHCARALYWVSNSNQPMHFGSHRKALADAVQTVSSGGAIVDIYSLLGSVMANVELVEVVPA